MLDLLVGEAEDFSIRFHCEGSGGCGALVYNEDFLRAHVKPLIKLN